MVASEVKMTDGAVTQCKAAGLNGEADELVAYALGALPSRYPMRKRYAKPRPITDYLSLPPGGSMTGSDDRR